MNTEAELSATLDQVISVGNAANHAMRNATFELARRQNLIDSYSRKVAEHERLIGRLYKLLRDDDLDGARDLVTDEYRSIHGPAD